MKKIILGMMLIVGSLSFADYRVDGDEEQFSRIHNLNFVKTEKQADENLSRGVKKSVINEELSNEVFMEKEKGGRR